MIYIPLHRIRSTGGNADFKGYYRGGGHSPISSKYGLAADQVLEWEVVTGTGQLITASPFKNSDLYWALSGWSTAIQAPILI